jgi:signal transduction histidine kinase
MLRAPRHALWWHGALLPLLLGSALQLLCLGLSFQPALVQFSAGPAIVSVLVGIVTTVWLWKSLSQRLQLLRDRCEQRLAGNRLSPREGEYDLVAALDRVLDRAHLDWLMLMNRDRSLFECLALEAERNRIAAQINSMILPRFSAMVTMAEQFNDKELADKLDEKLPGIKAGVTAILDELHPHLLAEAGLIPSIKTLADRFQRASRIETVLNIDYATADRDISLEAKFAIYRVIQEALNNIEKHSGASAARISLKQVDNELIFLIEDNGKGFIVKRSTQSRGLKNIQDRASAVGARVSWQKAVSFDTGSMVSITLQSGVPQNTLAIPPSQNAIAWAQAACPSE